MKIKLEITDIRRGRQFLYLAPLYQDDAKYNSRLISIKKVLTKKKSEVFTLPDFAWVNIPASSVRAIFRNVSYQETK